MDMSGMSSTASSMAMSMASTATTSAATATSTAKMSMSGMGGGSSCKISMLWNWYTIDSCFIARSWHVRSAGAFAGSCVGVILLVVALEGLRRAQRELDRYFRRINNGTGASAASTTDAASAATREEAGGGSSASSSGTGGGSGKGGFAAAVTGRGAAGRGMPVMGPLKWWQQLVRSALFMVQFAVGYFVMLLAMYYNGYIIICIFIGAFLGAAIFQWDTYYSGAE
ncbi:putative ctr copper transporter family protein [Diplodia seriata]|uniref:Copper transport protein n=1 Tax=Diplodia seriata TaxID=420778 RepID=A0A0G2EBK3_9PEZI|nr:putative ctr copper transporter family protein [Diplodia seriata]